MSFNNENNDDIDLDKAESIMSSDNDLNDTKSESSSSSESSSESESESDDDSAYSCFNCDNRNKSVSVVCCDCGVRMCSKCSYKDDIECGCYGHCTNCNKNINRGENGWQCRKCDDWYCNDLCKKTSSCNDCLDTIDKDSYIEELETQIKKLKKKLENIYRIAQSS